MLNNKGLILESPKKQAENSYVQRKQFENPKNEHDGIVGYHDAFNMHTQHNKFEHTIMEGQAEPNFNESLD